MHPTDQAVSLPALERAIDAHALTRVQYKTFLLCFLLSVLDGFDLQMLALAVPLMSREWGVPHSEFGGALAAAVAGLGIGSAIFGRLGDRYGRRPLLVGAGLAVGLGALGVVTAQSTSSLVGWRFLTGLGFGAVLPNSLALVADFMPRRRRVLGMTLLTVAMSVGAMTAGLLGPVLAKLGGWPLMFVVGGVLPILLVPVLYFLLNESPKYLAQKQGLSPGLEAVLMRLGIPVTELRVSDVGQSEAVSAPDIRDTPPDNGNYVRRSALYALTWLSAVFTFYLLVNWLPTLLLNAGASEADAMRSVTFINGGGLAAGLVLSWAMDRFRARFTLVQMVAFAFGIVVFLSFGILAPVIGFLVLSLLVGCAIGGGSFIMPGLASRLYPSAMLATAIGLITTLSRVGAVLGPIAGGWIIARELPIETTFALLAVPTLLGLLSVAGLHRAMMSRQTGHSSECPER